jgi:hypothetical protein
MLKLILRRLTVIPLILGAGSTCLAAECPVVGRILNGDQFFTKEYSGKVAWLKFGENSSSYYLLDDCNTIYATASNILYFTINTMFSPRSGDGSASFVSVQVAKLQKLQQTAEPTIERNDKWCRELDSSKACKDTVTQDGYNPQAVKGMTAQKFFDIHLAVPFDDTTLKYNELWWHATPVGGVMSSSERPERYSWNHDIFKKYPDRTLLSNRLYGFAFSSRDYSEAPFFVRIRGTEEVRIKVMSPLWPADPAEHTIRIGR